MSDFFDLLREILKPWNIVRRIKRIHETVAAGESSFAHLDQRLRRIEGSISDLSVQIQSDKMASLFLMGQVAEWATSKNLRSLQAAEFRAFSQWGEDGIIQFLVEKLAGHIDRSFVEFGVQNYLESNTLFLMMNGNWRGLVLDGEKQYIDGIRARDFGWKFGLRSRCSFVSPENINQIFQEEGFDSELGLLSIDVDGIDWYLWNALTVVRPGIVVIEYNRNFPLDRPVTIPYEPRFNRAEKHSSNKYYGASLASLNVLAAEKDYTFVGVESHQRNAFFVRSDLAKYVPTGTLGDEQIGRDSAEAMKPLRGMPVYNVVTKAIEKI